MLCLDPSLPNADPISWLTIRYTGHTLAKFMVTFVTGVITGFFAVAMSKSVAALIEQKNEFIQTRLLDNDATPMSIFLGFISYWVFGSVLVSIGTSLVRAELQ